eukprot:g127.t1
MPRRNLRKKTTEEDELTPSTSSKKTPTVAATPASLSFDYEDEPVIAIVKKSNKRIPKEKEIPNTSNKNTISTQTSTPGSYTAEKLAELKKGTLSIQGMKAKVDSEQETPLLRISGSFKPAKPSVPSSAPEAFIKVQQEEKKEEPIIEQEVKEDGFVPPNLKTIKLAKAKRERLREARLAPDYLPLGGASNLLSEDFKDTEDHRMASESDSDDQEDNARLQFIGAKKPQLNWMECRELTEEDGMDLIEDEEGVDSFADVQSRKGVRSLGVSEFPTQTSTSKIPINNVCILPVVNRFSIHDAADKVMESIERDIEKLKFDQEMTERNMNSTKQSFYRLQDEIQKTKTEIEDTGLQYKDVQEMKEYIADLCDCLKEKLPFIEELEEHLMELYSKERALFQEEDEMFEVDKEIADLSSDVFHQVMATGGSATLATTRSQQAIKNKEAEFTTEANEEKIKIRNQHWSMCQKLTKNESYDLKQDLLWRSHTKSLEIDVHLKEMQETGSLIFSDTLPMFGDLHAIKVEFENWRTRRRNVYTMAYIPDSLPALLAPFVRLEILTWSPFHGSELGLELQNWYTEIESYGLETEDDELVPTLVKQILLPAVRQQLSNCWSPFHYHLSITASEMIREMLVYVQMEDLEMQKLLQLTQKKLSDAVDISGVPPYPKIILNTSSTVQNVVEVRFYRCLHLIASIGCFHDVLPVSFLQKLLFEDLICTNMLPYLRGITTDPEIALPKVIKMFELLPKAWICESKHSRELSQIIDVMNGLSRSLIKHRMELLKRDEGVETLSKRITAFVDILKLLGANQKASELHDVFL